MRMAKFAGMQNSQQALDRIKPLVEMPEFLQRSVLEGTMAVSIAAQGCRRGAGEARGINDLFRQISPGLNVQRELVTMLSEISRRDDLPVTRLLKNEAVGTILGDETMSRPQKLQAIRNHLKKKRFPSLCKREDTYRRMLKSLKLNPRIQVLPPPFFESNTYRVTLNVDSRAQLRALLPELRRLIDASEFLPE